MLDYSQVGKKSQQIPDGRVIKTAYEAKGIRVRSNVKAGASVLSMVPGPNMARGWLQELSAKLDRFNKKLMVGETHEQQSTRH